MLDAAQARKDVPEKHRHDMEQPDAVAVTQALISACGSKEPLPKGPQTSHKTEFAALTEDDGEPLDLDWGGALDTLVAQLPQDGIGKAHVLKCQHRRWQGIALADDVVPVPHLLMLVFCAASNFEGGHPPSGVTVGICLALQGRQGKSCWQCVETSFGGHSVDEPGCWKSVELSLTDTALCTTCCCCCHELGLTVKSAP